MIETYGIGGIALALIGLVWKIWKDNREQSNKFFEAQEKHNDQLLDITKNDIQTRTKLTGSIEANTNATDKVSRLMLKVLKKK